MNNCSKGIDNKNDSCFDLDSLKSICIEYNKYLLNNGSNDFITENIINSNNHEKLLNELKLKLKCSDDICIIKKKFINNIKNKKIIYQKLKPEGPSIGTKWLSNWNIDDVMSRFQNYYKCFLYTGTVSIDFNQHKMFHIYKNVFDNNSLYNLKCFNYDRSECVSKNNMNNKITCIGTIYNTSKRSEPGQHWIATIVKRKKNNKIGMYFYDSVGKKAPYEIQHFFKRLQKDLFYNDNIEKKYNYIQHQYKNSECGVYCINFIDKMISSSNFDNFIKNKIKDDDMNRNRIEYFRRII